VPRPILINARAAARPELGGVERWARELTVRLPALRPGVYAVVRPPSSLVHRAGHAWEQLVLPGRAARIRAGLVLSPANLAPLAWPRNVVIIHDAAALRHPEFYTRSYVAWQRALLPAIARRAQHVITVSEFSRSEIVELLGVEPSRISVVPGGVDERFTPDADPGPARRALGLDRPYVLTVASRIARKNLAALGIAAQRLARQGIDVVVAGGGRPQLRPEAAVGGVRAVGHVADEHLPGLYAGARAFVLPSLYEGFGLTCLEAMAAGVPVVAADRAALPEVCGPAALLVDPDDGEAVAAAVERVLADEALRARLVAAGLARAGSLTWEKAAGRVDALLARLSRSG
jgi:glycosyltransferase involved in cell wall biosynthesis